MLVTNIYSKYENQEQYLHNLAQLLTKTVCLHKKGIPQESLDTPTTTHTTSIVLIDMM
jgi:hypothetical protein